MPLFNHTDNFNAYPNGNLGGNGPWAFAFPGGGCNTLGCAVNSGQIRLDSDTVDSHWTVTRITTAPYVKRWRIECDFVNFVNTTNGRWGFGLISADNNSPFDMDRAFGFLVQRSVSGGAVSNGSGECGPAGTCAVGHTAFTDAADPAGTRLKMIVRPSGANDYEVLYYKNGVLLNTRTHVGASGNVGAQPCFIHPSNGGTQGISTWDNFEAQELAAIVLTSISSNTGLRGTTVPVTLTGSGFAAVNGIAVIAIGGVGTGVTVQNVVVVNDTTITANFVLSATATIGVRTVTVSTDSGTSSTQTFTVTGLAITEFRLNELPPRTLAAVPFKSYDFNDQNRSILAGATDADFVDTFVFSSPIAVFGPLCLFIGSSASVGSLTLDVQLWLNDVLVETRTGVQLGVAGVRSFQKIGPRSVADSTAANDQNLISVLQSQVFSFGAKKLKVRTKVTANSAPDTRTIWIDFNSHQIDALMPIDEYRSFEDVSATVSGKGAADIGVPFTVVTRSGRGRLFTPVLAIDLVSAGGSGNRKFTLRVDGLDIMTVGPNALSTANRYHALGLISPQYVQNGTDSLENAPGIEQPPALLVNSSISLICEITSHSSPHTSTYTGRFMWGKFA